jgi:glucose-1-phosphate thymidylyltransferase
LSFDVFPGGFALKVIIPAAGAGTRLRPHTHSAPKALLYVAGKPILAHIVDQVVQLNPSEVTIIVGFLGSQIVDFVKREYDLNVRFVEQKELLGLGYAILLGIEPGETEDILVILGDTIVETDWQDLLGRNQNVLGVKEVDEPQRFGIVEVQGTKITSIVEKPENPKSNLAVVGVYYIKDTMALRNGLEEIYNNGIRTKGEIQVTDAIQLLLDNGVELHAVSIDGWYDCGRRETMLQTNRHLLANLTDKRENRDHPESVLIPPVYVAPDAVIERSIIGPDASIAAGCVIRNSIISNSIISAGARVEDARLTSSLIGNNAIVNGSFKILNVGDSSEISY